MKNNSLPRTASPFKARICSGLITLPKPLDTLVVRDEALEQIPHLRFRTGHRRGEDLCTDSIRDTVVGNRLSKEQRTAGGGEKPVDGLSMLGRPRLSRVQPLPSIELRPSAGPLE